MTTRFAWLTAGLLSAAWGFGQVFYAPKNIDWGETASSDVVRTESAPKITVNRNATPATATVTDGNKRLAITLSAQFLLLNGYMAVAKDLFVAMENISYQVAAGKIDRWQN